MSIKTEQIAAEIQRRGLNTPTLNAEQVDDVYHDLRVDNPETKARLSNDRIEAVFGILDSEYSQVTEQKQ